MRFLRRRSTQHRAPFDGEIVVRPIGHVVNDVPAPRPHGWEKVESLIELLPEHGVRIEGLGAYSHITVLFYMDVAQTAPEKPERMTLASGNTYGILATRSQLRPNHLGVSVVSLLSVEGTSLRVKGLDAIDGTAVLDIKPYLPEYDSVPDATIPFA